MKLDLDRVDTEDIFPSVLAATERGTGILTEAQVAAVWEWAHQELTRAVVLALVVEGKLNLILTGDEPVHFVKR